MGLARQSLLAISDSTWLRAHAPRWWFVKKAAARFMPGDTFDDALAASRTLRAHGLGTVFTQLGENVTDAASADHVVHHYLEVLDRIQHTGVDGQMSVKLTQLGLDVDASRCYANVRTLVDHAARHGAHMWIDMEQHAYLERTLAIYRSLLAEHSNVGVCLQAYLYRTKEDLHSLLSIGGSVRLVKGAYREPPDIAFPKKRDVDANFLALADEMLASAASSPSPAPRMVFGTHDETILRAIVSRAEQSRVPAAAFEFHLLFGIQTALQQQLARDGRRVRVLISYGDQWFAWYMRRLAERPANVLFALRAMMS
jgi:proline dehydrogenase